MLKAFKERESHIIFEQNRDYEKKQLAVNSYVFIFHHHLIEAEIIFTHNGSFTENIAESARMFVSEDTFKQLRHTLKLYYIDDKKNEDSMYTWRKLAFGFIQELRFERESAKAAFIHAPFGDYQIIFSGVMEMLNNMKVKQ